MSLQGFECGPERPGDSSMNQMLGNAMSVNVSSGSITSSSMGTRPFLRCALSHDQVRNSMCNLQ